MKTNWKEKSKSDKIVTVFMMICSISVIIMSMLQITDVWENAINFMEPMLGIIMLLQAFQNWKKERLTAIFSLCVAIFIFIVAFVVFFVK